MKRTPYALVLLIATTFLLQILSSTTLAQGTVKAKPHDNCDKLIMKNGETLYVDITRVDTAEIYYFTCDSLDPQFKVLKLKVKAVRYANDDVVNNNDETYGKVNTNSFGWYNYENLYSKESSESGNNKEQAKNNYAAKDNTVPRSQLKTLFQSCPESQQELKKSKKFNIAGAALIGAGCAYFAIMNSQVTKQQESAYNSWWSDPATNTATDKFDHHKYSSKKQMNAIIGMGITTVGFVLLSSGAEHYIKAINIYNEKHSSAGISVQYDLMLCANGLGIRMKF